MSDLRDRLALAETLLAKLGREVAAGSASAMPGDERVLARDTALSVAAKADGIAHALKRLSDAQAYGHPLGDPDHREPGEEP